MQDNLVIVYASVHFSHMCKSSLFLGGHYIHGTYFLVLFAYT